MEAYLCEERVLGSAGILVCLLKGSYVQTSQLCAWLPAPDGPPPSHPPLPVRTGLPPPWAGPQGLCRPRDRPGGGQGRGRAVLTARTPTSHTGAHRETGRRPLPAPGPWACRTDGLSGCQCSGRLRSQLVSSGPLGGIRGSSPRRRDPVRLRQVCAARAPSQVGAAVVGGSVGTQCCAPQKTH